MMILVMILIIIMIIMIIIALRIIRIRIIRMIRMIIIIKTITLTAMVLKYPQYFYHSLQKLIMNEWQCIQRLISGIGKELKVIV